MRDDKAPLHMQLVSSTGIEFFPFPAPAVGMRATSDNISANNQELSTSASECSYVHSRIHPGKLPESASELSNAARGLLLRLLDRDPRVRMRNLRQLQQCAFYMGFNFEHVKAKKITPKSVLSKYFPNGAPEENTKDIRIASQAFSTFDQPTVF